MVRYIPVGRHCHEAAKEIERLRAQLVEARVLLRRVWEFPDRPTPEEDEMRTHAEFAAEQDAWRAKREVMDAEVKRALAEPEAGV